MNYGDHNYKLQVAPVELVVSSQSSCAARLARHSQNAWIRHVERVESCPVGSRRAKWNLGFIYPPTGGVHPPLPKPFSTLPTLSPTESAKSSYTYPDRV